MKSALPVHILEYVDMGRQEAAAFGNWLCTVREGASLSRQEMADLLGVSRVEVWRWEQGTSWPRDLGIVLGIRRCFFDATDETKTEDEVIP